LRKKVKITKRQLKEDELLQAVMTSTAFLKEYWQKIAIGVCIIVVAAGISAFYLSFQKNKLSESGVLYSQARLAYQDGNQEEAITYFEQLVDQYGGTQNGKEGLMFLGNIYFEKDEFVRAVEMYEKCKKSFSKEDIFYMSAREGIAACYEGQKKYDEAAKEYEAIANSSTDENVSIRNLMAAAVAYQEAGDVSQAKKQYQKIIDEYPESRLLKTAENKLKTLELIAKGS